MALPRIADLDAALTTAGRDAHTLQALLGSGAPPPDSASITAATTVVGNDLNNINAIQSELDASPIIQEQMARAAATTAATAALKAAKDAIANGQMKLTGYRKAGLR